MNYTAEDTEVLVCTGDYVRDPMDGDVREIIGFEIRSETDVTILFRDGGLMGLDEIDGHMILLESEVH